MPPRISAVSIEVSPRDRLDKTVALIGRGIRAASEYQPLRLHAAQLATRAPRKNYREQVRELYDDFLGRWRYVRDPLALETVATSGPAVWGLVAGAFNSDPRGHGHGDCDDATVYMGAAARAIGLPVRIVTMSKPGAKIQSHVYPEINIPGHGWTPADPVAHPRPFGTQPPAGSRIRWDLHGRRIGQGAITMDEDLYMQGLGELAETASQGYETAPLEAFGLAGLDEYEPEDAGNYVKDFGLYTPQFDVMGGMGMFAEVEPITDEGYAMTPVLELGLADYAYLEETGQPYVGMKAYSLEGYTYQYQEDGLGRSWWKKLKRRIKKKVRKVARRLKKFARKVIKKIPGGKYLLKFGKKLKKIALKMVKPLIKLVGKAAPFLAKVAAFIPGYGPAISAGLLMAGKIAKVMKKMGVKKSKSGKGLAFKSGKQMKAFKKAMAKEARRYSASKQKGRKKRRSKRSSSRRRVRATSRMARRFRPQFIGGGTWENEQEIPCSEC